MNVFCQENPRNNNIYPTYYCILRSIIILETEIFGGHYHVILNHVNCEEICIKLRTFKINIFTRFFSLWKVLELHCVMVSFFRKGFIIHLNYSQLIQMEIQIAPECSEFSVYSPDDLSNGEISTLSKELPFTYFFPSADCWTDNIIFQYNVLGPQCIACSGYSSLRNLLYRKRVSWHVL